MLTLANSDGSRRLQIKSLYTGVSGNIRINEYADRLYGFDVWDYAKGQDSYQKAMLIELSQPPDKVGDSLLLRSWLPR